MNNQIARISLSQLSVNPEYQLRDELHEPTVKKMVKTLKVGDSLPPILVNKINDDQYEVIDGHHRLNACQRHAEQLRSTDSEEEIQVDCLIVECDIREAHCLAAQANSRSSRPLNNNEKVAVVEWILKDTEYQQWSDRKIAALVGCSQPFVGKIRKKLDDNGYQTETQIKKCRNGKTIKTQHKANSKKAHNNQPSPSEAAERHHKDVASTGENPPQEEPEKNASEVLTDASSTAPAQEHAASPSGSKGGDSESNSTFVEKGYVAKPNALGTRITKLSRQQMEDTLRDLFQEILTKLPSLPEELEDDDSVALHYRILETSLRNFHDELLRTSLHESPMHRSAGMSISAANMH